MISSFILRSLLLLMVQPAVLKIHPVSFHPLPRRRPQRPLLLLPPLPLPPVQKIPFTDHLLCLKDSLKLMLSMGALLFLRVSPPLLGASQCPRAPVRHLSQPLPLALKWDDFQSQVCSRFTKSVKLSNKLFNY